MRRFLVILTLLVVSACKTGGPADLALPPTKVEPLPPPLEEVQAKTLPEGPSTKQGLIKGTIAPWDGVMLSPRLAGEYVLVKAERDKLRPLLALERQVNADRFQLCNQTLTDVSKKAERSWWEENKGLLGFFTGFVVAGAAAIGLAFGLNQASK